MRWFRPSLATCDQSQPLTLERVRLLIAEALSPGYVFAAPVLQLRWEFAAPETVRWEIYQGRLLDAAHTREVKEFEAWSIYEVVEGQPAAEPLLSVKLAAADQTVHVVRGLLCYIWQPSGAAGNVIEGSETTGWT